MIPTHRILHLAALARPRQELNHVLIRLVLGVDTGLCALDGEPKRVGDDEGVCFDFAEHEAHYFERAAGARVHDHFEQGDGADADVGEVVRVGAPWAFFVYGFLVVGRVGVEGVFGWVDELDGVLELWGCG